MGEDPIEFRVRAELARRVDGSVAHSIPASTPFVEVGIDSLDVVLVLAELDRADARTGRTQAGLTQGGLWQVAGCIQDVVDHLRARGD